MSEAWKQTQMHGSTAIDSIFLLAEFSKRFSSSHYQAVEPIRESRTQTATLVARILKGFVVALELCL